MSDTPNSDDPSDGSIFAIHGIGIGGADTYSLSGSGSVLAVVGANNVGKSTLIDQIWNRLVSNASNIDAPPKVVTDLDSSWRRTPAEVETWLHEHSHVTEHVGFTTFTRCGVNERTNIAIQRLFKDGALQNLAAWFVQRLGPLDRSNYLQPATRPSTIGDPPAHPLQAALVDKQIRDATIAIAQKLFGIELYFDAVSANLSWRMGDPGMKVPPANDLNTEYAHAVGALRNLHEQGDGVRSALGLLLPMIANPSPVWLVDEPEAFLHPPQARLMGTEVGRLALQHRSQVITATHDKNILQGIIESGTPVDILHLTRVGDVTRGQLLRADDVAELWKDPMLRYGNALDGLFHSAVIVTEADRDSRFYHAAIDAYYQAEFVDSPAHNLMFLAANGKQNMAKIVARLKGFGIRTVTCPDLDILNNKTVLQNLVEAHGGTWSEIEPIYTKATRQFMAAPPAPEIEDIKQTINTLLDAAEGRLTQQLADQINEVLALPASTWQNLKKYGMAAFLDEKANAKALLSTLDELGIVAVTVGELERFLTTVNVKKGSPEWLPTAFREGAHTDAPAIDQAKRLLNAAGITSGPIAETAESLADR